MNEAREPSSTGFKPWWKRHWNWLIPSPLSFLLALPAWIQWLQKIPAIGASLSVGDVFFAINSASGGALLTMLSIQAEPLKKPWRRVVLVVGLPMAILLMVAYVLVIPRFEIEDRSFVSQVFVTILFMLFAPITFRFHKDWGILTWWLFYAFVFGFSANNREGLPNDVGILYLYVGLMTLLLVAAALVNAGRIFTAEKTNTEPWLRTSLAIWFYALPPLILYVYIPSVDAILASQRS